MIIHGMIKPFSDTRIEENKEYKILRNEYILNCRKNNEFFCIFCREKNFTRDEETLEWHLDIHHVAGRDGTSDNGILLLLDVAGFSLCHRICHTRYDETPMSVVVTEPYWKRLAKKIKVVKLSMYEGIINKYL